MANCDNNATVVGVEGSDAMVERGYENARHNSITNVDFYAQDLTADFSQQEWAKQHNTFLFIITLALYLIGYF